MTESQPFSWKQYRTMVPVSDEVFDEAMASHMRAMQARMGEGFRRMVSPWEFPDRPIVIAFEPFPRWERLKSWAARKRRDFDDRREQLAWWIMPEGRGHLDSEW